MSATQGTRNRRNGHQWEVDVANYMAQALDLDVVTARNVSGGRALGVDLVTRTDRGLEMTVESWSIECKAGQPHQVTAWMRQARNQASGSALYCVVAKRARKPVSEALVYVPFAGWLWWLSAVSSEDHRPLILSLDAWCELAKVSPMRVPF